MDGDVPSGGASKSGVMQRPSAAPTRVEMPTWNELCTILISWYLHTTYVVIRYLPACLRLLSYICR